MRKLYKWYLHVGKLSMNTTEEILWNVVEWTDKTIIVYWWPPAVTGSLLIQVIYQAILNSKKLVKSQSNLLHSMKLRWIILLGLRGCWCKAVSHLQFFGYSSRQVGFSGAGLEVREMACCRFTTRLDYVTCWICSIAASWETAWLCAVNAPLVLYSWNGLSFS